MVVSDSVAANCRTVIIASIFVGVDRPAKTKTIYARDCGIPDAIHHAFIDVLAWVVWISGICKISRLRLAGDFNSCSDRLEYSFRPARTRLAGWSPDDRALDRLLSLLCRWMAANTRRLGGRCFARLVQATSTANLEIDHQSGVYADNF